MENRIRNRKNPRLKDFDYSRAGAYFITICTKGRKCILGRIVDASEETGTSDHFVGTGVPDCPKIILSNFGEIAKKYLIQLNEFYDNVSVERFVIMPNHIHLILMVWGNDRAEISNTDGELWSIANKNATVPSFVSTFKRFCNKEHGDNIWQTRYYDHIIRNYDDFEEISKYIRDNPKRWFYDKLYSEE